MGPRRDFESFWSIEAAVLKLQRESTEQGNSEKNHRRYFLIPNYMPGPVLMRSQYQLNVYPLHSPLYEQGDMSSKVMGLAQGHMASKRQSQDARLGSSVTSAHPPAL